MAQISNLNLDTANLKACLQYFNIVNLNRLSRAQPGGGTKGAESPP